MIHISALFAIALASYYPGLDIVLAILYIIILTVEGLTANFNSFKTRIAAAISLQMPGLILAIFILAKITRWDLSSYSLFILQYWYIPLIPLISLLSFVTEAGIPLYHYILMGLPLLMSIYSLAIMQFSSKIRPLL